MSAKVNGETITHQEIERSFQTAIEDAGLPAPDRILADGNLHRFPTNGNLRDDSGWYCLFADGYPAGAFGCFRSGLKQNWRMSLGRALSDHEKRKLEERTWAIRRQAEHDQKYRQDEAATEARKSWDQAQPADDNHPYLVCKGVKPHGLKQKEGRLMVPVVEHGAIISLQWIDKAGRKLFQKGCRTAGGCFTIGKIEGNAPVVVCEGYATAASVYESTEYATVCAFCAGNLSAVVSALRGQYPSVNLIIAADNDENGRGLDAAKAAAQSARAVVVMPEKPGTDWNDVYREDGASFVREQIVSAASSSAQYLSHTNSDGDQGRSIAEQFIEEPSHGLAADLVFAELGRRVIFERFNSRGDGEFFARDAEKCYYKPVSDIRTRTRSILETAVREALAVADRNSSHAPKDLYTRTGTAIHKARTNDFLKSTIQLFSERVSVPELVWNGTPQVLPTLTGVLDFSGRDLVVRESLPGEYFRAPIPLTAESIVEGGDTTSFDRFISELFPDPETRETALQVASMALGNHGWKVFVVCTNEAGNNGKNLFFNILARLLPGRIGFLSGAVILSGADKGERRFGRAELEGLSLAVFDESAGKFDLGEIKRMTGLSPVKTERKGRDPKDLKPTWAPIALCNQLPDFSPATDQAFLSRLIVLPFNRVFYDTETAKEGYLKRGVEATNLVRARNPDRILEEVVEEQPAVLHKLIRTYMMMRDHCNGNPLESKQCQHAKEAYRSDNDRVENFFQECLQRDESGKVQLKRLLQLWEDLYGKKGEMTPNRLSKELVRSYGFMRKKRTSIGYVITGVKEIAVKNC